MKNRPKCRKMWKNLTRMSKNPVKNIKIKRITGNKPSQISKNRQKCQKTLKKASKTSKNSQKCQKNGKNDQKYAKIFKNIK